MDKITAHKDLAGRHYENFPVVSLFVPRKLRKHVAVVYAFARTADDIADEGDVPDNIRLEKLDEYENLLTKAVNCDGVIPNSMWEDLSATIQKLNLTPHYFYMLLDAFRSDILKKRFRNFTELQNYCVCSANPVGRIILEMYGLNTTENNKLSDKICTALQLTNFLQDVSVDWQKGRIYIPQNEMEKFGIKESIFDEKKNNINFKDLMKYQIERTMNLFDEGKSLIGSLPIPLNKQIYWTVLGGSAILKKIEKIDYDVLNIRPKLSKIHFAYLMVRSLTERAHGGNSKTNSETK